MVALVTPMRDGDDSVDLAALKRLVEFHVDNGSNAIIAVGTTGESATLDFEEHCMVVEHTVQSAAGRIPVIAGTGANSTREAIELTRKAAELKVDACLLVVPYYNKPTQEGLYRHFRAIAEAVVVPQILYNVPGRTACDMLTPTCQRLAQIDNIVGLKDATGDLGRARELIDSCGGKMDIFSGDDATALEHMLLGGRGDISVTANVAPRAMADMCAAALAGEEGRARSTDATLRGLHDSLFLESNPIPVKWAVHKLGLIGPAIRLPMTPLSRQYHEPVRAAMRQAGVHLEQ